MAINLLQLTRLRLLNKASIWSGIVPPIGPTHDSASHRLALQAFITAFRVVSAARFCAKTAVRVEWHLLKLFGVSKAQYFLTCGGARFGQKRFALGCRLSARGSVRLDLSPTCRCAISISSSSMC